jgi:hypothetical protein
MVNGSHHQGDAGYLLADALSITWYCKSKTVLFQGPRGSEVADSLKKNISMHHEL